MGNTCSPGQNDEEVEEEYNMEVEGDQTMEKFTTVINKYQAENEALKKQLEEYKNGANSAAAEDNEEKTKQNEKVMNELAEIKALVEAKDAMLVRGRVEAALISKATTMLSSGDTTKLCMKGSLKHVYRSAFSRTRKTKWIELHVYEGETLPNDFIAGFVMLTYSESQNATTTNRCQVVDVSTNDATGNEIMFTLKVSIKGSVKDMVLACETAEEREEWVRSISAALAEVKEAYESMHKEFSLKIKFEKEKLGFRVQETPVDEKYEEKSETSKNKGPVKKISDKVEDAVEDAGDAVKNGAETIVDMVEELVGKGNEEDEKIDKEPPCKLTVSDIMDDSLHCFGLKVNCVLCAINDIDLQGKGYSEQFELLQSTPKPFVVTFSGKNFLLKKNIPDHGYNSILKELVADEENAVKRAFNDLIKGTPFENELKTSNDQTATITALLTNQRRLLALLQNFEIKEMEL